MKISFRGDSGKLKNTLDWFNTLTIGDLYSGVLIRNIYLDCGLTGLGEATPSGETGRMVECDKDVIQDGDDPPFI